MKSIPCALFVALTLLPLPLRAEVVPQSWMEQSVVVRQYQPAPYSGMLLSEIAVQALLEELRRYEEEVQSSNNKAWDCAGELDYLRSESQALVGSLWECESALNAPQEPTGKGIVFWLLVAGVSTSAALNIYLLAR